MGIALTVLAVLVLAEAAVIYGLLNRLLIQARIPPMAVGDMVVRDTPTVETPAQPQRRKLFSVEIPN